MKTEEIITAITTKVKSDLPLETRTLELQSCHFYQEPQVSAEYRLTGITALPVKNDR